MMLKDVRNVIRDSNLHFLAYAHASTSTKMESAYCANCPGACIAQTPMCVRSAKKELFSPMDIATVELKAVPVASQENVVDAYLPLL